MAKTIKLQPKIRTNSWQAIVKGARLESLPGAAVPVIIAIAMAAGDMFRSDNIADFKIVPAVLCFLFAEIMQINANFINDYFDFKRGFDSDARMGNARACTQGWLTLPFMQKIILATNILAAIVGLPIMLYGNWQVLLAIGAACMLFSLLYTTFFSTRALGDTQVLLFFGIVPVCATYYVLTDDINWYVFIASVACGFEIDSMLVINNFRDHEEDLRTGKHTISHIIGREWTLRYFLAIGFICVCLGWFAYYMNGYRMAFHLQIIYLINHINRYNTMRRIWEGPELNNQLAENGKNILLYGLLIAAGIALSFM